MEPFGWASGPGLNTGELRQALIGGPLETSAFPPIDPDAWDTLLPGRSIKEITYRRILGEPFFMVLSTPTEAAGRSSTDLVAAKTLGVRTAPFAVDALIGRVRETYPDAPILEARLLEAYDSYHYSRDQQAPLPILRVKFDDPDETWLYIDPQSGQLSTSVHRLERVERWIYHGFHSLDFGFWYYNRPFWDIGVIVLSLGGLATSAIGLFVGTRRLWRGRKSAFRAAQAPS
jgi:hypothetical protein